MRVTEENIFEWMLMRKMSWQLIEMSSHEERISCDMLKWRIMSGIQWSLCITLCCWRGLFISIVSNTLTNTDGNLMFCFQLIFKFIFIFKFCFAGGSSRFSELFCYRVRLPSVSAIDIAQRKDQCNWSPVWLQEIPKRNWTQHRTVMRTSAPDLNLVVFLLVILGFFLKFNILFFRGCIVIGGRLK